MLGSAADSQIDTVFSSAPGDSSAAARFAAGFGAAAASSIAMIAASLHGYGTERHSGATAAVRYHMLLDWRAATQDKAT